MTKPEDPAELLTVGEAARLLGVSTRTVLRYEEQRKFRAVLTPGGHRRFARGDLLAARAVKATTPADA